ncbi:MAG: methionine synthase [Alistipes sp.]|nr:methionine synthase [Alistipes sp.]
MGRLEEILKQRIMVLDGAMGTMIQRYGLSEADFRGAEFARHNQQLEGNNDILVLTRPDVIGAIHRSYLEAGADIIETCTFNSQRISQAEYGTQGLITRLNRAAAELARAEVERMNALTPDHPRFVAGSVGPTGKTLSMSPDVENPALREIDFDTLYDAYIEQIDALVAGGVDMLLVETVFDTLNAKAALMAAQSVFSSRGVQLPVVLSITVADAAGRTLSGQTLEAVVASVSHFELLAVGLNCSFGATQMEPFLRTLSDISPYYISAYPNAGLPNAMGEYSQTPELMAQAVARFAQRGMVNIVGGCCGSTPDHIRAIAQAVEGIPPRIRSAKDTAWLAGLEAFDANGAFVNVGERCNVAGSRKFLRLIGERNYGEALAIARRQVEDGAMVLDVNMDDAMLDAKSQMTEFLNIMASDPDVARVPWMIDSSDFDVITAALKTIQGKAIVNSLSLKEGEQTFIQRARVVKSFGAAVVVMAFDEQGQATTYERKIEICARAYRLLTECVGFDARDIIFDPNILTVATGIAEHNDYARDFIRATAWIRQNLPGAHVSGGVSNLSFAFRGNNYLREAMHAVFLYYAVGAGMDMAILNPATAVMYEDIPQQLREALEDVILNRRADAAERLTALASEFAQQSVATEQSVDRATLTVERRLADALQRGDESFLEQELSEALSCYPSAAAIIEGPLMEGMIAVGKLFGEGKMFLPQVVKTARTMKRAVSILQPYIEQQSSGRSAGRYLVATVKGDVHDIGKNIAAVILRCNGFEVIDLGVMVAPQDIVAAAVEHKVDYIGLSGLITPSLEQMCATAVQLREAGVSVPLFISGATTSALHTAVKIAPLYDGAVFHIKDASQNPVLALQLAGENGEQIIAELKQSQQRLREQFEGKPSAQSDDLPRLELDWSSEIVHRDELIYWHSEGQSVATVRKYINWRAFHAFWRTSPHTQQGRALRAEAEKILDAIAGQKIRCRAMACHAYSDGDAICATDATGQSITIPTPRQSSAGEDGVALALADFVAPKGYDDQICLFCATVPESLVADIERFKADGDDYNALLYQSLADRIVEATSEYMHRSVRNCWIHCWESGSEQALAAENRLTIPQLFAAKYRGIRPAVGYSCLPDQRIIFDIDRLLNLASVGISLTESGAMYPQSSVCGLYIGAKSAKYFIVKRQH